MEWISVKDELPKRDIECLVYIVKGTVRPAKYIKERNEFERHPNNTVHDRTIDYHYEGVTHWKPFPYAPVEDE